MAEARLETLRNRLAYFGVDPHAASALVGDLKAAFVVFGSSTPDVETVCFGIEQATSSGRLTGEELRSLTEIAPFLDVSAAPAKWVIRPEFSGSFGFVCTRLNFAVSDLVKSVATSILRGDRP